MLSRKIYFQIFSALLDAQWLASDAVKGYVLHTPEYYAPKLAQIEEALRLFRALTITYTAEDWADIAREAEEIRQEMEAPKAA
jgi:hypothetical protein